MFNLGSASQLCVCGLVLACVQSVIADELCEPEPNGKVTICHIPPGNPGNAHTISVSPNAVDAHLRHGDHCAPCTDLACVDDSDCEAGQICVEGRCVTPPGCETDEDCDDDNACTIDICKPEIGCQHTPIDSCFDGDPCTIDECDPEIGCVYTPIDCEDDDPCTINECADGECLTAVIDCPEGEVCQDGECVPFSDELVLQLDIKPRKCPNDIRRRGNATVWVGLLGTDDFDISSVDHSALELRRADGLGDPVAPTHVSFKDVGTPFQGELGDCHRLGKDGITDVRLKFKTRQLVGALELADLARGTTLELILTGYLDDGRSFVASDWIRLTQ